jgi:hypothetical protein
MWKVEGLFAEGKQRHNVSRAKYRGRAKVQIQAYLTAMVQDLKRLVSALLLMLYSGSLYWSSDSWASLRAGQACWRN